MRIGPFFFDSKEIFLLVAAILLGVARYFNWSLWEFNINALLTLVIIMLILKGLLPSVHNEVFFLHALVTISLTIFNIAFFQIILFYFITFFILKGLKVV